MFSLSFQMKTSAHQVVTGVTPTLVVETSLARISASATRASMEMDTLVLVRKQCACVFFHMCVPLVVLSTTKCPPVILASSSCVCQLHLGTQHSPDTSPSGLSLFTDVDECAVSNGHCEHNCSNELGGYSCRCASGYQLDQDGHNCTGKT